MDHESLEKARKTRKGFVSFAFFREFRDPKFVRVKRKVPDDDQERQGLRISIFSISSQKKRHALQMAHRDGVLDLETLVYSRPTSGIYIG